MSDNPSKNPVKVHVKFPHLSAPNDGYDENGLWCGMTQEEVKAFCRQCDVEAEQMKILYHWVPSSPAN